MSTRIINLFVYGSLRQGFHNPFFEYIRNHFEFMGQGAVRGALYDLGEIPAGVPSEASTIIGELYTAKSEDDFNWAIAQLDDYEGMHLEEGEHSHYRREVADVMYNGENIQSWMYWYTGNVTNGRLIPSGDVMDFVRSRNAS
jgi:gamma-glutamylcyclotransferase (GGCT)/AIG2-like uncharacterized protein YtfP